MNPDITLFIVIVAGIILGLLGYSQIAHFFGGSIND